MALAEVLDVKPALRQWNDRLDRLSVINPSMRNAAIRVLGDLAEPPSETFDDICFVLPQLRRGMGQGGYLRSLPLLRVGTKFVESNQTLLTRLLDGIYSEQGPTQVGGLEVWLDVRRNPAPARGFAPHLISLMMDVQTLERHSCKTREPYSQALSPTSSGQA